MRKVLIIANYKGQVGGISGQVSLMRDCLVNDASSMPNEPLRSMSREHCSLNDGYDAEIFSTQGNVVKRLWKFIELIFVARKYDVLHIHGCSDWGMLPIVYGVIAGKMWRKRIIVTYHGGDADKYFAKHRAFARRWLNRADKVIVLNGYLEKVFAKYDIPCVVIPNIVLLREDVYVEKKEVKPKFISVRHMSPLYRVDMVIKAFAEIVDKYPEATLTVLGDGELREELEMLAVSDERLAGSVQFIGQVPNERMYEYLRENDIMLSAPRIDNMPVSLMEAMNAGVLVISSKVGGVPYMIEHQKTGLMFEVRGKSEESRAESRELRAESQEQALAEQILWALEHQKESVAMIEAAHEEVKKYTWKKVREQLLPMYGV